MNQRVYERAVRLHNRAAQCQRAGEPVRPEQLYVRSLRLKEQLFGPDHVEAGFTLNNLGLFYKSLGRLGEAKAAYGRALRIFEVAYGGSHPAVGDVLYNLSELLKKEAEALEARSRMIGEAAEEPEESGIREGAAVFRLRMGRSRIHRFGVFAEEKIPEGAGIIEYTGERVSRRYWAQRAEGRTYLLRLNAYWAIDGSVGGSGAELLNHCCEPNCKFLFAGERVWVTSRRQIEAGEELL